MNISNGFDIDSVYNALKTRVLWQAETTISDSLRYFEDFHTLCDLSLIVELQPDYTVTSITDSKFVTYLANLQRSVVMECLNSIYNAPQIVDKAKLAFYRNNDPLPIQLVSNTSQFVGMQIYVGKGDFAVKLNSLQLYFTNDCTFNLYLYNDFFLNPVSTLPVTAVKYEDTLISLGTDYIFSNLTPTAYKGGRWYLGYYQDEIAAQNAQAIYYPVNYSRFHPCDVRAFGAPLWVDPNGHENFQRNNIGANNLMYGMNLEISTYVDATNNIVQNAHLFDELIGLQMAAKVLEIIVYSYRLNAEQRITQGNNLVAKIYTELNQAMPTQEIPYSAGLKKQIEREVKRVKEAFQKTQPLYVATA